MKTGTGRTKWDSEAVIRILRNEKYCGNVILQKTFKKDFLAKREVNNGEVRKFFVENGHEAIITPEQYDMA
ncbi:MAG: recombinase family protein [Bullifex sp.]|nr:recombinase family protein [Bullifex sp.]